MNQSIVFIVGLTLFGLLLFYMFSDRDRTRRNVGSALSIGILLVALFALIPQNINPDLPDSQRPLVNLKGGIDIVGGTSYTVRIDPNIDPDTGKPLPVSDEAVLAAMATIEKRLGGGIKDLLVQRQGKDRIIVEMPGATEEDARQTKEILEQVAKLEIRAVHPDSYSLAPRVKAGEPVPGYELLEYTRSNDDGETITSDILVNRKIIVTGKNVQRANVVTSEKGVVSITLDSKGGDKMREATSKMNIGYDQMATVLDGVVLSAATTQAILGRNFQVSGLDTQEECRQLARGLENPLTNPLVIEEAREVSARLGQATVNQGIISGIVGLFITLIFILVYYRTAGIIALIGLGVNIAVLFGIMAMFGFTFTLPGIAGIILTIGVAVDANVLIYERLREEMAAGKSIGAAIKTAFEKAFSAIFDANITTLIIAIILMSLGSGTVKGFAVTLTIGIITSLITALIVARVLFYWGYDLKLIKNLNFMQLFGQKSFGFMKMRKMAFPLSIGLIVVALGLLGVRGDKSLGIDFLGGSVIKFQIGESDITADAATKNISDLSLNKQPLVQVETTQAAGKLLSVKCATEDVDTIITDLRKDFPALQEVEASNETVSATLGKEFLVNSLIALAIGLLCIMIYITIRFEFSFAVGAFCALFHDLLIVLGAVALYSWLKGSSEFSLIHVGAVLTIAGYSINDTIVVFDRIRETLTTQKGEIEDLMNDAINSTLSRTVLTSLTTFFVVLVLFIFGGQALKDFSFAILIGVIVGTYSSIFIASPIVYLWAKRKGEESIREDVIKTALRDEDTIVE